MFNKNKTVDGIMSSFTKQLAQLRALSDAKSAQAATLAEQAMDLRSKAYSKDIDAGLELAEADRADRMAVKIENFING